MTPVLDGLLFDRAWICTSAGAAVAAVSVAALALVVGRALRGRPAPLRYGLLLAALVVLGIVPVVAAASRLGGWGAVRISNATVDRPLSTRPFLVPPAVPRPTPVPDSSPREEAVRPERVAEPAVVPMRVPTFREVASCLLWVWLGVLVFSVGRMVRDLLRLRTLRRSLTPSPSPAAVDLLREAARSVGLTQPPRLFESAAVPVPVVIGPVRPVVVLPAGMATTLDREKLTAVLLHEAAHVAHGDLWVGLLQHAVAAVFWWCPPVHRLNRRLAEAREEICDDYVVLAQGDGFQLAEVLVEMAAGLREKRQRLAIGTLGAIDEKPALEGRVERLVDLTRKAAPMTRMNRLAMAAAGVFGAVSLAIVVATTIHAAEATVVLDPREQRALDAAFAWIATRQQDDGGWSLSLGESKARAAATALAILPFLARGHDHTTPGPYRDQVGRGINFLVALVGDDGSALKADETMYSQGLVAMTLCRAYGRTQDPALKAPAQAALDFIMAAQQAGGGWTYTPHGSRGDTSILGYQVAALAAGEAAGLSVKPETWTGVARHLDSVQGDADGSTYGYMTPEDNNPNTTAVGLLARLRSGWKLRDRGVALGVGKLLTAGPPKDIYHCYHASRLVHSAADAEAWMQWRTSAADALIKSQVQAGDEAGSWQIEPRIEGKAHRVSFADLAGPLLKTSLAALTLVEPLENVTVLE
jgi:beta-lactamase regulating signal transducer with metallopeptidase domain